MSAPRARESLQLEQGCDQLFDIEITTHLAITVSNA
jgi:hypothetical protein